MGQTFSVSTDSPQQSIDISARVNAIVAESGIDSGFCHVMVLHSTASIVINETADPNIGLDVIDAFSRLVPTKSDLPHHRIDDNAHSHIKSSMLGPSEMIPVERGELVERLETVDGEETVEAVETVEIEEIRSAAARFAAGPLWYAAPQGPCSRGLASTQLRFGLH